MIAQPRRARPGFVLALVLTVGCVLGYPLLEARGDVTRYGAGLVRLFGLPSSINTLMAGANITIAVDPTDRTRAIISSSGGGSGRVTIADESTILPASDYLDFRGSGVSCTAVDGGLDGSVTACTVPQGYATIVINDSPMPQRGAVNIKSETLPIATGDDAGTNTTEITIGGTRCELRTTLTDATYVNACTLTIPANQAIYAEMQCTAKQVSLVDGGPILSDGAGVPQSASRFCLGLIAWNANGTYGGGQTTACGNIQNMAGVTMSSGLDASVQWIVIGMQSTNVDWDCTVKTQFLTKG